jgi:hypothetical protein
MAFSFANLLAASVKRGVLISVMKHLDKTFQSYRQRCLDFSDRFSQLLKKPSISLVGIKKKLRRCPLWGAPIARKQLA